MKTLSAAIIAITLATPPAVAQQKSMCDMSPESCPACGHLGQPRCPTFAEEQLAAKAQGCRQAGVGSAYVHFTHKPGRDYVQMSSVVSQRPAWARYAQRIERRCMKSGRPVSPWEGVFYTK